MHLHLNIVHIVKFLFGKTGLIRLISQNVSRKIHCTKLLSNHCLVCVADFVLICFC